MSQIVNNILKQVSQIKSVIIIIFLNCFLKEQCLKDVKNIFNKNEFISLTNNSNLD